MVTIDPFAEIAIYGQHHSGLYSLSIASDNDSPISMFVRKARMTLVAKRKETSQDNVLLSVCRTGFDIENTTRSSFSSRGHNHFKNSWHVMEGVCRDQTF